MAVIVPAAVVQAADDIVVVARKPKEWRGVLIVERQDALRCRVVASSSNDTLDAQGCDAMTNCFTMTRPQFAEAERPAIPTAARRRLLTEANRVLNACFAQVRRSIALRATPDPSSVPGNR